MERRRPSIPSGREHLQALAERHGIKSYTPKERLHPPSSLPQYAGPADHEEATKVLAGARRAGEKFKDPSKKLVNRFKSQSKKSNLDRAENWDFTFEERALLFDDNVRSSGNISLAQALLEYKGDDLLDTSTRGEPAAKVARRISKGIDQYLDCGNYTVLIATQWARWLQDLQRTPMNGCPRQS